MTSSDYPAGSVAEDVAFAVFLSVLFVVALRLHPGYNRGSTPEDVDRSKVVASVVSTLVCVCAWVLRSVLTSSSPASRLIHAFAFSPRDVFKTVAATYGLFSYEAFKLKRLMPQRSTTAMWLNLKVLIVAPICEETVFRVLVLESFPENVLSSHSLKMVVLVPLMFGVAHANHAWISYKQNFRFDAVGLFARLVYTSLFGAFACRVYLSSRSIFPIFFAHAICNSFGLPTVENAYDLVGHSVALVCFLLNLRFTF